MSYSLGSMSRTSLAPAQPVPSTTSRGRPVCRGIVDLAAASCTGPAISAAVWKRRTAQLLLLLLLLLGAKLLCWANPISAAGPGHLASPWSTPASLWRSMAAPAAKPTGGLPD